MNKISFLLLALLVAGCSKDYNGVVDVPVTNFQVSNIATVNSFQFSSSNPAITLKIKFSSIEGVSAVYCDIYSPDNTKLNSGHIDLLDDGNMTTSGDSLKGDDVFSGKYSMSETFANGNYNVQYFAVLQDGSEKLLAQQIIKYDNGQSNIAPVISEATINPDTVTATGPVAILTTVKAIDQNGQNDIDKVYFIVYKPDGTTNNSQIQLYDNGNIATYGDQFAGDSVYSRIIQVDQNNDKGTYTFKFRAIDRGGKLSNEISKTIVIQ